MKIFYLIMFVFFSFFSIQCNSQKLIDNNKKNSNLFLKWILDKQEEKIVSNKPIDLTMETLWRMKDDIKFSSKDSIIIMKQIEINNRSIFDSSLTSNKTFLDKIDYEKTFYLKISKPIYFDNGKKLWIYIEKHCPDTCGEGFIQVYEVNKSAYKLLFHISTWIS